MATNKNAVLRYNVLDKCLSNFGRTYIFQELLDAVNDALLEDDPESTGIKTRQLRDDLSFMRSESGYGAPIESYSSTKPPYYRYDDKNFSINKQPLNATEAQQLKSAIAVLQRFEGSPEFEWVQEISPLLNDQFGLKDDTRKVIAYETNVDYEGYKHISTIFNAITQKRVLKVNYRPFGKEPFDLTFHPYYLKQYNNRWFALGYNEEKEVKTWNIALDRIVELTECSDAYRSTTVDWEDHFYDMVGVTRKDDSVVENVKLLFSSQQAAYIATKPIHASQKSSLNEDGTLTVRLKLIVNYELESLLLSFGDRVEVLEPIELRNSLEKRLKLANDKYNK
ncbi:MAG: WYL domain-containing protein [Bacteroidetes bacterium]|nr:MAG: WYL domain-containing protein [Bacteroidota bacterium]